ncbi:MAG: hypothetical protein KBH93_02320 [Anaerolineae bacterium]|nr:hypothetical protein [Anaerolineae bacterium]
MVPVDLFDTLNDAWRAVCCAYDVGGDLPDMGVLFEGADLSAPAQASAAVLTNMLTEAIGRVGRFSPWYRQPVSAFGLVLARDVATGCVHWMLAERAVEQWERILKPLEVAIARNVGLILSVSVLDVLEQAAQDDDPCVMAACLCTPPRVILVSRSVLRTAQIRCDACQQQFHLVEDTPGRNFWEE